MVSAAHRRRAELDLAKKLRLEPKLARDLVPIVRRIAKQAERLYRTTGQILNVTTFGIEIEAALAKHYGRVSKAFAKSTLDAAEEDLGIILTQAEQNQLDTERNNFISTNSKTRAGIITDTHNDDLNNSFTKTIAVAAGTGAILTIGEVARQATDLFRRRAITRSKVVQPITETQNAAEGIKSVERSGVAAAKTLSDKHTPTHLVIPTKTWVTVGDNKVRLEHEQADGQTDPLSQPFTVGGEMLMHPGDTSLGASPGNIINCRCSAQMGFEKQRRQ